MFNAWTVGTQYLLPLILLAWVAFARDRSLSRWAVGTLLVGTYILAIALAGVWPVHPVAIPAAYMGALALFAVRGFRRSQPSGTWPVARRDRLAMGAQAAMLAVTLVLARNALAGRRAPDVPAVDLAFPLEEGTYYVANGGSIALVNAHLMTLSGDRYRAWRGQSYGVDLLGLDRRGFRARGVLPGDPAAYAIFGRAVLAPCSGTVVAAVDGLRDLSPPRTDREHMAGNHVIIACGDAWVVLGHFRETSICVAAGDVVETGQPLGQVGNTGNTDEPHLHIHAQRPGSADSPLGGEPLVVRFDGRYLARNAVIRVRR